MPGRIVLYGRQTPIRRDAWQKQSAPNKMIGAPSQSGSESRSGTNILRR